AGNLRLERARPTDRGTAAPVGEQVDVGVVAADREAGDDGVRHVPGRAVLQDLLTRDRRAPTEATDGADAARGRVALALPLGDGDHWPGPVAPARRVGNDAEHHVGR